MPDQSDASMHGRRIGVEPARDEAGPKQPGQRQHMRQVAVDVIDRALLTGGQILQEAGAVLGGQVIDRIEVDKRAGYRRSCGPRSESCAGARRRWGRAAFSR